MVAWRPRYVPFVLTRAVTVALLCPFVVFAAFFSGIDADSQMEPVSCTGISCSDFNRYTLLNTPKLIASSADLIALNTSIGARLLLGAGKDLSAYFSITPHFEAQETQTYCGVATAVCQLNALNLDDRPTDEAYRPFSYFTQGDFFNECVEASVPKATVLTKGMTLLEWEKSVSCHGAKVKVSFASDSSVTEFRRKARRALQAGDHVAINFARSGLGQSGFGHFSPLGAYSENTDRFLILDVARYKFPPVWASAREIFRAMNTTDPDTGLSRGYALLLGGTKLQLEETQPFQEESPPSDAASKSHSSDKSLPSKRSAKAEQIYQLETMPSANTEKAAPNASEVVKAPAELRSQVQAAVRGRAARGASAAPAPATAAAGGSAAPAPAPPPSGPARAAAAAAPPTNAPVDAGAEAVATAEAAAAAATAAATGAAPPPPSARSPLTEARAAAAAAPPTTTTTTRGPVEAAVAYVVSEVAKPAGSKTSATQEPTHAIDVKAPPLSTTVAPLAATGTVAAAAAGAVATTPASAAAPATAEAAAPSAAAGAAAAESKPAAAADPNFVLKQEQTGPIGATFPLSGDKVGACAKTTAIPTTANISGNTTAANATVLTRTIATATEQTANKTSTNKTAPTIAATYTGGATPPGKAATITKAPALSRFRVEAESKEEGGDDSADEYADYGDNDVDETDGADAIDDDEDSELSSPEARTRARIAQGQSSNIPKRRSDVSRNSASQAQREARKRQKRALQQRKQRKKQSHHHQKPQRKQRKHVKHPQQIDG
eukprot:TRINITY_DN8101_c0_g1_i5.p1 TRINITY_DN8101_c0_g1~~TRINITY_DN8101_c0_g1_i5.p1  ORF type:complete len:779 (+),score=162.44 TRINITY_DN8101_c0_g1_i5:187-2523(+)